MPLFRKKNNYGDLFRLSLCVPNFTFVALPVRKILGGTLKILGCDVTGPCHFFGKNNYGDLFRLSLWIRVPNFTFVTLPVPETLGATLKNWESRDPAMPNFWKKIFRSVSLVPAKTCAKFSVYSFIHSITPNRMHVFACEMPEMHPKIVLWWV